MPGSPLSPRGYNCAALQSTGAPAWGAFCTKAVSPFLRRSEMLCLGHSSSCGSECGWCCGTRSRTQVSEGYAGMRWTVQRKTPKMCHVSIGSPATCSTVIFSPPVALLLHYLLRQTRGQRPQISHHTSKECWWISAGGCAVRTINNGRHLTSTEVMASCPWWGPKETPWLHQHVPGSSVLSRTVPCLVIWWQEACHRQGK